MANTNQSFTIEGGFYPIVYVRGFAPTANERENTFYDTYYGYSETSVEKRNVSKQEGFQTPLVFEGQLIRFMKEYGYVDAANGGLQLGLSNATAIQHNPTRSMWISRFYDRDVLTDKVRTIEEHAEDLRKLICEDIPKAFRDLSGVNIDLGKNNEDYKVILIAHSMGGLVSRCLIQNILGKDSERWIHRLVTIGSPHGGIELSAVPDFLEELFVEKSDVLSAAIFKEPRMRQYLNLGKGVDLKSLNGTFPEGRCLCIIGSDYNNYSVVRKVTGSRSDGLVKQSNAYIQGAYYANVHRAHSGRRGIINSFETYENIRRFLFGDIRVQIWLENLTLGTIQTDHKLKEFYDLEFAVSVRGTGVFLHQRKQNPCENAIRFDRDQFPIQSLHLHTGFLDTKLRALDDEYSHFLLAFRIAQYRVQEGWLFDHQYPERTIYSESLEIRLNLNTNEVDYRWLSETTDPDDIKSWQHLDLDKGNFKLPLRAAGTISGDLLIRPEAWPNPSLDTLKHNAPEDIPKQNDSLDGSN